MSEKITAENFTKYVEAKGIDISKCPSCGRDGETAALLVDAEPMGIPYTFGESLAVLGPPYGVLVASCTHCGFLWQYSRAKILEWMKDSGIQE